MRLKQKDTVVKFEREVLKASDKHEQAPGGAICSVPSPHVSKHRCFPFTLVDLPKLMF